MSNYTDLENLIEEINNSAIYTKEVIDSNIYDNTEQEITAQKANTAVSEVNDVSKINDTRLINFLKSKYSEQLKVTVINNANTSYYNQSKARLVQDNNSKCIVIEIPARTYITVSNSDDFIKNAFVSYSFNYDNPYNLYNLNYIENGIYSPEFNGQYLKYCPVNTSNPIDVYYHSNTISYIYYNKTFIVIPCYSTETGWVIPEVNILSNNGGYQTILQSGNQEISDFTYEIDVPQFTYDMSQDYVMSLKYTWNHDRSIINNLSTHTTLKIIKVGTDDGKWISTADRKTYLITLNSLDTISFKNIYTASYGFTVIDLIPVIGDNIISTKMPPTAETMYLEDRSAQLQSYEYYNYINSDISNLVITNTTSNTVYVYIDIDKFTPESEILVNGTNILLPNSNKVILDIRKQLEDTDVEALTDNVIWLKKEIAYLYGVIFRLLTV